jgi:hypothetical protein
MSSICAHEKPSPKSNVRRKTFNEFFGAKVRRYMNSHNL